MSCNSSYTPAPTSSPIEDGTIGPYDCNVGLYDLWPLVAGECSYDTSISESFMIECADDGDSATLYQYSSLDCTGDVLNETNVTYFYCGSSSLNDCIITTITGTVYNDSGNCSIASDAAGTVQFNVPQIDDCISVYNGYGSFKYLIDDDSIHISSYFGSYSCQDYVQFNLTLTEGCNEIDGESFDATFSTSTIAPTTGESSTTAGDDDDDDDDDSYSGDTASKICVSNAIKHAFSFIVAIVVYKL